MERRPPAPPSAEKAVKRPRGMRHADLMENLFAEIAPQLALRMAERARQEEGARPTPALYRSVISILLRSPDERVVRTYGEALRVWFESQAGERGELLGCLGLQREKGRGIELLTDVLEAVENGLELDSEGCALEFYSSAGFAAHDGECEIVPPPIEFVKADVAVGEEKVTKARRLGMVMFLEHVGRVMGERGDGWEELTQEIGEQKRGNPVDSLLNRYLTKFPRRVNKLERRALEALQSVYLSGWAWIAEAKGRKSWRNAAVTIMETINGMGKPEILKAFVETMSHPELKLEFCYVFLTKRFSREASTGTLPKALFPTPGSQSHTESRWNESEMDLSAFEKLTGLQCYTSFECHALLVLLQGVAVAWLTVTGGKIAVDKHHPLTSEQHESQINTLSESVHRNLNSMVELGGEDIKGAVSALCVLVKILFLRARDD